ncbi:MAG: hypothetical protein ABH827_06040 [bacterium]
MFKKFLLILALVFLGFQFCGAVQNSGNSKDICTCKSIDDIPVFCANLAKRLDERPFFTGKKFSSDRCKVLLLDNWNDCLMCDVLNYSAHKLSYITNLLEWKIKKFGTGCDRLYSSSGDDIGTGIMLCVDNLYKYMGPIGALKAAYQKVIDDLKNGWTLSLLEANSDIVWKKPEKEWYLFIKKKCMSDEDVFVGILAKKLGFKGKICCYCDWLKIGGGFESRNNSYLWVRKNALNEFKKIFKFDLKGVDFSDVEKILGNGFDENLLENGL